MTARYFNHFTIHCLVLFLVSRQSVAQLPTIELHSLSRLGGQIGTDFDLHVQAGNRVDEVDKILFSHPGITGKVETEPAPTFSSEALSRFGRFRVSIPENVPPGLYEARVQGRFGLSNSRAFWVTTETWQTRTTNGLNFASAINIPMTEVLQDECTPRQRKYYHLNLRSQQRVSIRLATSTLDSRARLLVTLVDTLQKQVAMAEVIENQDTRFEYFPAQSGTHTLIVSDHLFRGGHEYPYAIQVTPLENEASAATNLLDEWRSRTTATNARESKSIFAFPSMQLNPNMATLRKPMIEGPTTIHDELQFGDKKICPIPFPGLISGRFDMNGDQDWFEFSLEANNSVAIEVVSERLAELTDPQLIVYRVEGSTTGAEKIQQIAIADDIANVATNDVRLGSRDAVLQFTAPESGRYRLLIRDQQRSDRRSNRHRYAVELRTPVPDFSAVAYLAYPTRDVAKSESISPTLSKNGTLAVAVAVMRYDGWSGSIEAHSDGLPTGVATEVLSIESNQTNGHMILVASNDVNTCMTPISIRVATRTQEPLNARSAKPIELTWGAIDTQKAPVARITSGLVLAVEDRDEIPLTIKLGMSDTTSVERGAKLKVPIVCQRGEGGKQSIVVRLRNAPPKIKVEDVTINADQNEGEIEINVPQDAPLGEYTCWAQCETKLKLRPNIQALERSQKRLAELELVKREIAEDQMGAIEAAIVAQNEKIKQFQESTKLQDFAVQLPSTSMRFRIVEKP